LSGMGRGGRGASPQSVLSWQTDIDCVFDLFALSEIGKGGRGASPQSVLSWQADF